MPADNFVATPELRFVSRLERIPTVPTSIYSDGTSTTGRVMRILQQKWVIAGTYWHEVLTAENSEWRDVPLVTEGE